MIRKHLGIIRLIHRVGKRAYCSSFDAQPSYYHRIESEPLLFMTVGQLLKNSAEKYGNKLSLIAYSEKKRLTFVETLQKADRLACSLLNMGLEKGDRVAIWAPNYEFWYISMMAIARAGLICVTLNPVYTINELEYCLEKVDIKAVIAPESFKIFKYYEMLSSVFKKQASKNSLEHLIIYGDKKLPGAHKFDDLFQVSEYDIGKVKDLQSTISPDDGFMIQFTSGTTGKPKATVLSHFGMVNNSYSIGIRSEFHKNPTKVCMPLPLFHVGGCLISTLGSLHHGYTMVFPSPNYDSELLLRAIVEEKCNVFSAIPTFCVDILAKQKQLKLDLPQIDQVMVGGAIISPQVIKDLMQFLKVKKIVSVYGLTETSSAIFQTLPEDSNEIVEEFVGTVSNNVEAKVVDREGNTVPFGQPGELCIRSPVNMLSYWNDPEKTKETIGDDKWLKTGDQFILYKNGYGKICGRLKEMIIRGAENIFPKEIEDFLNTHENVLESQVIGVPDERMGEEVCAFFKLKDRSKALTAADVKEFCKENLAHFKIPRYSIIVNEFPKTQTGKVQKHLFLEYFKNELGKVIQ